MTNSFEKQSSQCCPMGAQCDRNSFLSKKERLCQMLKLFAGCLNSYFMKITDSLGLNPSFENNETDMSLDDKVNMIR